MTAMSKSEWRKCFRSLHEGRAVRDAQSAAICRHILQSPEYKSAHVIGGYMPLLCEADIRPVLLSALREGKKLVLPLCAKAPHMTLRLTRTMDELVPGAYGILQPRECAAIIPVTDVDLLLVPLEGIDRSGIRLGKGGGYYDRLLADADIMTIGCALTWQWTERLPKEPWDKPLQACADKNGLHHFEQ